MSVKDDDPFSKFNPWDHWPLTQDFPLISFLLLPDQWSYLSMIIPPPFSSFSTFPLKQKNVLKFLLLINFLLYHLLFQWPHPSPCLPNCPPWRCPLQYKKMTVPSFSFQHGWKHKCPLKGEWVSNMWYTRTMGYYSALKGKEIPTRSNMDKLWRHYNNWNKLVTKWQTSYHLH